MVSTVEFCIHVLFSTEAAHASKQKITMQAVKVVQQRQQHTTVCWHSYSNRLADTSLIMLCRLGGKYK
jgi:hypothetical protein